MGNFARTGRVILLLLSLLTLCLPTSRAATETLQVGYVPGTGFLEEDRPGHMQGNGYEYMEFLSNFLGAEFTYVPCVNWWEAGAKLARGEIDLLPAMPGDYKTLPFARRTDHVIARFPMELVVQDNFSGGPVKIGTLDYNYPLPSLPKVASEHGFTYELITFNDPTTMKKAFMNHEIDGCVQPLLHPGKKERVLALFDRVSYRLLVRPEAPELFARVNAAQDNLLLNQPNIRNRLNDKYERAKGFPLVLSPAEKAYLQDKKVLRAAVFIKAKPYMSKDSHGNWTGATQALLNQLEKDLDIKVELVETDSLEEITRWLKRGNLDIVADVPCDFSWLNGLGLLPTQSYMDTDFVAVSRHGISLPDKPKVAAVEKMFETDSFIKVTYPKEQIIYYGSWAECFQAVSNGLADLTYAPRAAVPPLIQTAAAYNLSADTETVFRNSISIGVAREADIRLWQILNKEINHLPPRLLSEALNHGSHEHIQQLSPRYLLYHYPLQAATTIFLTMTAIMGIIYYRSRSQRQQLAELERLAYTDRRTQLPNLLALEQNLPHSLLRLQQQTTGSACYVVVLTAHISDFADLYDSELLTRSQLEAANVLNDKDWVLATAAGMDPGELICLCAAVSSQTLAKFIADLLTDFHEQPLTWLGGICPLADTTLELAAQRATLACHYASADTGWVKLWQPQWENE